MILLRLSMIHLLWVLIIQGLPLYAELPSAEITQEQTQKPVKDVSQNAPRHGKRTYFGKKSARKISEGVQAALTALPQDPFSAESIWDQNILKEQTVLASRLQEFMKGTYAASLKDLKMARLTVEALHTLLIEKGFQEQQVKSRESRQKSDVRPEANLEPKIQKVYMNPDGGMVRVKPLGHRWHPEPHTVKCVLKDPRGGASYANEAFKVTDDGRPVPKSPRLEDGLRKSGAGLTHPDQVFGWTDVIMEEGHINLSTPSS